MIHALASTNTVLSTGRPSEGRPINWSQISFINLNAYPMDKQASNQATKQTNKQTKSKPHKSKKQNKHEKLNTHKKQHQN